MNKYLLALSLTSITVVSTLLISNQNTFNLKSNVNQTGIVLNWDSIPDSTYKVHRKSDRDSDYKSIGVTNLDNAPITRVLNIYPTDNTIPDITFTTWDGETLTLPKSASLKMWMESPNESNPKGFGRGKIEVTPINQIDFSNNPSSYLKKDIHGNWNYDVVMIGSWDANAQNGLTIAAKDLLEIFIKDNKGFLLGHDTTTKANIEPLQTHAKLSTAEWLYGNGSQGENMTSEIIVRKEGLLTQFPWDIGDIDSKLIVPASHSWQMAGGDVWMDYTSSNSDHGQDKLVIDERGTNNFYLTTHNNTAMIQTGHSNGNATPDEQKLLANTLFYLNQLSSNTSLEDTSANDINAPNKPIITLSEQGENININLNTSDNGTSYSYYIGAIPKNGSASKSSNSVKSTIVSGIKGFSYEWSNNPETIPDNIIDTSSNTVTTNKKDRHRYLHVKSIDNAGNVSAVAHYEYTNIAPKELDINNVPDKWVSHDVEFNITQPHNKNIKIATVSPQYSWGGTKTLIENYGYKVDEFDNPSNFEVLKNYDLVISDNYYWSVLYPEELFNLYNHGVKILTIGNDTEILHPINSYRLGTGDDSMTFSPSIINEATFVSTEFDVGTDGSHRVITSKHKDADTWHYRVHEPSAPSTLYIKNNKGGEWIHSQSPIHHTPESMELLAGYIDYLTDYITPFHIKDVQYKINTTNWKPYRGEITTISEEGETTIFAKNIANNNLSSQRESIIKIDKSIPTGTLHVPANTSSLATKVDLLNLYDKYSGVDKVRFSTTSDFSNSGDYIKVNNTSSISSIVNLPPTDNHGNIYGKRTIYAEIVDNAGHKYITSKDVMYDARGPEKPILYGVTQDSFYTFNTNLNLSWSYKDSNLTNPSPQSKAIVTATNSKGEALKFNINGSSNKTSISLPSPDTYKLKVEVFNNLDKSSSSDETTIRYGIHTTKGVVCTTDINSSSPLKYLKINSTHNLPGNSRIQGDIYYKGLKDAAFSSSKKLPFDILAKGDIIKLPEFAKSIKIVYTLYRDTIDNSFSPSIDQLVIFGK